MRRRRDPKTGRILGNLCNLYVPLTPFAAMQLDPDYLSLVGQALSHAAKAVQIAGMHTLKKIAEDALLNGRTLPTRLQLLAQRMARHGWTIPKKARMAHFGMSRARLQNPKRGQNPRQTALFRIRRRTLQYVRTVLMKYVRYREQRRCRTCACPIGSCT